MISKDIDYTNLFQLEPMTKKQQSYLTYLVSSLVDYGRKLYIKGNAEGYVVPVLLPKDYPFTVEFEDISKGEAQEIIGHIKKKRLDDICRTTAVKIYLDGQGITLADFLMGKRIVIGIEM